MLQPSAHTPRAERYNCSGCPQKWHKAATSLTPRPPFTRTFSQSCVQGALMSYLKIRTVVFRWSRGFVLCWQMSLSNRDHTDYKHVPNRNGTLWAFLCVRCQRQSPPVSQPCVIFPVWEMKKMCPSAHANKRILVFPGLGCTPTQYFRLETLGDLWTRLT